MPDFLKKAQKQTSAVCGDDETPRAALFVRPRTGEETKRLGAPGGVLSKMSRLADPTGEPGDPFEQNCVLVVTDERLLVFGHGTLTGRVRGLVGELPLTDIDDIRVSDDDDGPLSLTIGFRDGDAVVLTPGSRSRRFVAAFEDVRATS